MELIERIEELVALQEKLVNILLMSGGKRLSLPTNYAFDILYSNLELLDLLAEAFLMFDFLEDEYDKERFINLSAEALAWMALVLPAIEDSCPIFVSGISYRREPIEGINYLLGQIERLSKGFSSSLLNQIVKELQSLSKLLRYQISLASKSYKSLA